MQVRREELVMLPFKYCLLGHGGVTEDTLLTNVELTPQLSKAIEAMRAAGRRGRGCGATDPQARTPRGRAPSSASRALRSRAHPRIRLLCCRRCLHC